MVSRSAVEDQQVEPTGHQAVMEDDDMLETYDTYDGSTESDEDRLLDGLVDTYDALVPPPLMQ